MHTKRWTSYTKNCQTYTVDIFIFHMYNKPRFSRYVYGNSGEFSPSKMANARLSSHIREMNAGVPSCSRELVIMCNHIAPHAGIYNCDSLLCLS